MPGRTASGPPAVSGVARGSGPLALAWRAASTNAAQVVVSIAVAALLALATWLTSQASSAWTSSTRLETKAAALLGEDLRHVYQDEVPLALQVSLMDVRADALDAAGAESPAAAVEARVLRKASGELRASLGASASLLADRYAGADHGYAVNRRLADVVGSSARVARADVIDAVTEGDRFATGAAWAAGAAVALALGYAVVRVVSTRRRRGAAARAGGAGAGDPDIGVVPGPWQERTAATRLAAGAALLAWLLLPVLTAAQLVLGSAASSDGAAGSRRATGVASTILGTQLRQALVVDAAQTAIRTQMVSLARQFVDVSIGDPGQEAIARADAAAAGTWATLSARMLEQPAHADGVDADIVQLLASGDAELAADLRVQQEAVDASDRAGGAADLLSLAVLLAGLTAAVAAMAKVAGRTGRLATVAASGLVAAAVAVAALAVVHASP